MKKLSSWLPCLAIVAMIASSGGADPVGQRTVEMVLSNMGKGINTAGDDFYPTITADGSTMVFSLKPEKDENSDIYISTFSNGAWTKAQPVREINTEFDEQTPYISPDGKILLFSSNREGSVRPPRKNEKVYFLTNDLYISYKKGDRWSAPQWLHGGVNTADSERAPSVSRDGKTLYFSRYAGDNIYSSKIYSASLDGITAGNITPLPRPVNSDYSDFGLMPSLSKPGFYFSSSRPEGLGLWDIYFVSYINNEFGIPINLGEPINSEFNDLSITEIGNVIYFCSDRNEGIGKTDIYTLTISTKIFRIPDTGFLFSVVDRKTGKPVSTKLDVTVSQEAQKNGGALKKYSVDSDEKGAGELKIDYYSKSLIVKATDPRYMQKEIRLVPVAGEIRKAVIELDEAPKQEEKAQVAVSAPAPPRDFRIGPVYFEYRSSDLTEKERQHVRKIYGVLKNEPSLCVKIVGHTDPKGSDGYNMKLGYARALTVKNALVKSGLKKAKFEVVSMGERRPSYLSRKTSRQEFNRRVIVSVVECEGGKKGK